MNNEISQLFYSFTRKWSIYLKALVDNYIYFMVNFALFV